MKHLVLALSMSAVILTAHIAPAMPSPGGQSMPPDHLICYKMTDSLRLKTQVDMFAQVQPEFSQEGCTLIKPIEFCVPATKRVHPVGPAPLDPNIVGAAIQNDYICYSAKCPNYRPPAKSVVDQFGVHSETNFQVVKVCVPAVKNPAGCPDNTAIVRGGPACRGACPLTPSPTGGPPLRQLCKTVKGVCKCVPQTKQCGGLPDSAGQCGGTCPAPEFCRPGLVLSSTGVVKSVTCTCQPPPPPVCGINTATGQCGGSCEDPTNQCVFDNSVDPPQCHCAPPILPCHATIAGTCGTTTTSCTSNVDCAGLPCVFGAACGGECPVGLTCSNDATTEKCSCQGPTNTCSQNELTGQCGGPCPQGQDCILDTTGHCGCQDAPCGSVTASDGTTTCGGPCPQRCLGGDNGGHPCTGNPDCIGVCNGNKCLNGTACTSDFDCSGVCGGECKADATGACNCQPATNPDPCLNSTTCSPVPCPGMEHCSIVAGTTFCRCQCDATSCGTVCPAGSTCSLVGAGPQCACQ